VEKPATISPNPLESIVRTFFRFRITLLTPPMTISAKRLVQLAIGVAERHLSVKIDDSYVLDLTQTDSKITHKNSLI
jgi:hypothetical protein